MGTTPPQGTNGSATSTMGGGSAAAAPQPRLLPLASLLDDLTDDAAARHDARTKGVARGPVSGLAALDRALGDVFEPGLHVLHAGPGVGKTAMGLQVAAECGFPALVLTTEMRPLELLRRVIARTTDTYLGRLKSGEYRPEDVRQKAQDAITKVPGLALADACDAYAGADWLRDAAKVVRGEAPHLLLVVDSVHSWSEAARERELTEYDRLDVHLSLLRALAGELRCPVLAIAERNRVSMREGGLHASAGNRAFEYAAESVLSLDVDEKTPAPAPDERVVRLTIAKNRNGPARAGIKLAFHGALQRFRDLEAER
jgi:replicative DNA helicase